MLFVAETVIALVMARSSPERRGVGEQLIHFDSILHGETIFTSNEAAEMPKVINVADTLEVALAKDLAVVPQVRHVLIERVDGPLLVWISVDDPLSNIRKKIYQRELALIEAFPEVDFDFNLVIALGRNADEIATGARVVFSREEAKSIAFEG